MVAEERGLVRRTRHSIEKELLEKVKRALKRDPYALKPAPPQLQDCVPHKRPVSQQAVLGDFKLIVQNMANW